MSAESLAVSVRGLVKSYGSVPAVRGIDLDIRPGEIFALLGPNGAGKTTTVEILEGYRRRDRGEVSVLGYDSGRERARIKPRVGIVLQKTGVDKYLVGLRAKHDGRVTTLSGGQLRRLDMAIALAGDPDLLFLDEPTTGFDPSARREAWEVVKSLASLGKTVLLTTHYMDEAQYLAVLPVRHFALSMQAGFLGTAFSWTDVLVVAAWGRRRPADRDQVFQLGTTPGMR